MIIVYKDQWVGTCNACCERPAIVAVKFKSEYGGGGHVVGLCKECLAELKAELHKWEAEA